MGFGRYILRSFVLCLAFVMAASFSLATEEKAAFPNIENVAISSDGSQIAFISDLHGSPAVWIADRSGTRGRPLFVTSSSSYHASPDWSPAGASIVYVKDSDIFVTDIQGRHTRQLTKESGRNTSPRFSPDSQFILFLSDRRGKRELWLMNNQGHNQEVLGLQHLIVNDPAFSPDGKSIVYSGCVRPPSGGALAQAKCHLYITSIGMTLNNKPDMSPPILLTEGVEPDWGANGIVFTKMHTGGIWLINSDGSHERQITKEDSRGLVLNPKWDKSTNVILFSKAFGDSINIWSISLNGTEKQITHY